jgi:hypothetical protein
LGAFINLESTGPWGPDVVFQHTGDWTLAAYARSAPHPRGTTLAQDFFDLGGWLASSRRKEESLLSAFFFLALEHMLLLFFSGRVACFRCVLQTVRTWERFFPGCMGAGSVLAG